MKLINDFYHIVATDDSEGKYVCKVKMNAAHNIYSVHFPGNPVTPGVCLVQMVAEMLEQKYSKRFVLSTAVNIKFIDSSLPMTSHRLYSQRLSPRTAC